jgi:hypothetical protein
MDTSSDGRIKIDARLGARRIRAASFVVWRHIGLQTRRMKKMGEMGRKGGSMTPTASHYGFIYTIFGLGASHMGL